MNEKGKRQHDINKSEKIELIENILKSEKLNEHEKLYYIQAFLMGFVTVEKIESIA